MRAKKTTIVQARIDPKLKKKGDNILKAVGITPSQAVNAMYAQIVMKHGLPFELKIPNQETLAAIKESEAGSGKSYANFQEMLDDIKK